MKRIYIFGLIASCAMLLTNCDDFLNEPPSKGSGIEITTVDQLAALLDASAYADGVVDANYAHVYCSDCMGLSREVYDGFSAASDFIEVAHQYTWNMNYLSEVNALMSKWSFEYEQIAKANVVLDNIDKVSGDNTKREEVRARAYVKRAYSYLELANYYCMPYSESTKQSLGLPLKRHLNFEESLKRATLEATYAFIENDIKAGLNLKNTVMNGTKRESWRESGALANAVAARFYLNKGDYVNAKKYAEDALTYANDILDLTSGEVTLDVDLFTGLSQPNTYSPSPYYEGYEADMDRSYYYRCTAYMFSVWAIPSNYFLGLLDKTYDLRYKFFINQQFQKLYVMGMYASHFTTDVPGYITYFIKYSNAPNAAEMTLIIAECQARSGNITDAMKTLNDFRAKRIDPSAPSSVMNLTAANKDAAVRCVLEERTREFPFTQRWNDIRRCNFNEDPNDDVTVTRDFYEVNLRNVEPTHKTYSLSPTTKTNYAAAIPSQEIVASNGEIEQNPY